ncbi:hypothetical protein C8N28_1501 [Albibacterium bauzanense]|uniref:Uncharacterized protein n=1 Tax=Albibacterium bauzanense TaxID=653929 RepID=A0A4R1LWS3_9SPHI|nr:hypothetical protein C8N28_1501 [Albibacterium bauzanense]
MGQIACGYKINILLLISLTFSVSSPIFVNSSVI